MKRSVLSIGLILALVPAALFAVTDYKLAITWIVFTLLGVAYTLYRRSVGQELLVALFFALFVTSYVPYIYETNNLLIGHINLYPLVAWTAGLVVLRETYERIRVRYRWFVTSLLYLLALYLVEYAGYYMLGIRLAGDMPSLIGLGVIHGTVFQHVFYPLAGPTYLLVTDYLRVS